MVVQSPSSPTMDNFDFGSSMGLSYQSVPSSPKRFGDYNYLSAPSSPSRLSQLYAEFEYFSSNSPSSFEAANKTDDEGNEDSSFAFFVSGESDKSSRSAEELFVGGKIKPLNESRNSKDPFVSEQKRGRERERASTTATLSSSNSGRRTARSHSPYRKSLWESEQQQQQQRQQQPRINKEELSSSSVLSSSSSSKGSKRWSLKDFLLFRSASEGRASSKKYYKKNGNEEVKGSSSFRSSDSSRKKGPVSAHELHYNMKKAESEDMKKRTFLPYRQGILGRLGGFGL